MSENISLTESFLKLYSTNQQNIVLQKNSPAKFKYLISQWKQLNAIRHVYCWSSNQRSGWRRKWNFEHDVVVGERWGDLSISKTADLLRSHLQGLQRMVRKMKINYPMRGGPLGENTLLMPDTREWPDCFQVMRSSKNYSLQPRYPEDHLWMNNNEPWSKWATPTKKPHGVMLLSS